MSEEKRTKKTEGLSPEELEEHTGETLPDREEMTLMDVDVTAPIVHASAEVFTDSSTAHTEADPDK